MAVRAWGQHYIQAAMPQEDPVMVGSLWVDISGTVTLKVCTAVSPYTFSAISGDGSVDRVVETGETRTIADDTSVIVASDFAIQGSGILAIEGDGVFAVI